MTVKKETAKLDLPRRRPWQPPKVTALAFPNTAFISGTNADGQSGNQSQPTSSQSS